MAPDDYEDGKAFGELAATVKALDRRFDDAERARAEGTRAHNERFDRLEGRIDTALGEVKSIVMQSEIHARTAAAAAERAVTTQERFFTRWGPALIAALLAGGGASVGPRLLTALVTASNATVPPATAAERAP